MTEIPAGVRLRDAVTADVPAIVALYHDDSLGSGREDPGDLAPYEAGFAEVDADPHQRLLVLEREATGELVGTFQFSVIPGVSQRGLKRAMVESVRIAASERGSGLGTVMMQWAIDEARRVGCRQIQLTSNSEREDAHRFYRRLGFVQSHAGFKMKLD